MPGHQLDREVYIDTARRIAAADGDVRAAGKQAEADGVCKTFTFETRAKRASTLGLWGRDGRYGFWASEEAGGTGRGSLGASPARDGHEPYVVKGVSTLYDKDGEVRSQWIKTSLDEQKRAEAVRRFIEGVVEDARGVLASPEKPTQLHNDLLVVIPMGDPHFGLYAWAKETGDDFNLEMAERMTFDAVDRLVASAPAAEEAILLNLGDYFHADNSKNQTPQSGHALDVDTRFALVAQVGLRAMVRCVRRMREKYPRVIVRNNPGNHDPHSAYMLTLCLSAFFDGDAAVEVDLSPAHYWFYRFGKVLIGSAHGDGAKPADLPLLMATDRPEDWGATAHRYWLCGHVHHRTEKEHPGAIVESFRTLAGKDAWHAGKGYRSGRDMTAIVYHRATGELERHRCDVAMLAA